MNFKLDRVNCIKKENSFLYTGFIKKRLVRANFEIINKYSTYYEQVDDTIVNKFAVVDWTIWIFIQSHWLLYNNC